MKRLIALISILLAIPAWGVPMHKPRQWSFKPPVGTQINRGHPLARGLIACFLFNEGGGGVQYDSASGGFATIQSPSGIIWATDQNGAAINYQASAHNWAKETFAPVNPPFSIVVIFTEHNLASQNGGTLFAHDDGTTTNGFQFSLGTQVIPQLSFTFNTIGTVNFSSLTVANADVYYFAGVVVPKNNAPPCAAYMAPLGVPLSSQSITMVGGAYASAVNQLEVGNQGASVQSWYGHISMVLYYNRTLSAVEMAQLNSSPYAFLNPPSPSLWWMPKPAAAGGGAVAALRGLLIQGGNVKITGGKVTVR